MSLPAIASPTDLTVYEISCADLTTDDTDELKKIVENS